MFQSNADHAPIHSAIGAGIPLATILQWLSKYGFALVLQILPIILGGGFSHLTIAEIVAWGAAALAALKAGQPLPPIPV